ncbi:hypothetical protein C0J52_15294 [Blattella germanica]|nr:hypothetical protein C0J52_15294 [Blattella germanica]
MYSDVARKPYVIEVNGLKIWIQHIDIIQNHIIFFRQQKKCLNSQASVTETSDSLTDFSIVN